MQDQEIKDMLGAAAAALPKEAQDRARPHQWRAALGEGASLPNLRTLADVAETVGYTVFVLYLPQQQEVELALDVVRHSE